MTMLLPPGEAKQLLKKYSIPTTREKLATNKKEAVNFSKSLKFPVVMKIVSPDIIHKTEAKGIVLDIKNAAEAATAYDSLISNAKKYKKDANIQGVLVQETLEGKEVIIGTSIDPHFGPTIMVGLGGILVEIFKDVSFRIIPIKKNDALEMLQELKGYQILKGIRREKSVDIHALVKTLLKVSKLVQENPHVKELDINPLFVVEKGVKAADVRVLVE